MSSASWENFETANFFLFFLLKTFNEKTLSARKEIKCFCRLAVRISCSNTQILQILAKYLAMLLRFVQFNTHV